MRVELLWEQMGLPLKLVDTTCEIDQADLFLLIHHLHSLVSELVKVDGGREVRRVRSLGPAPQHLETPQVFLSLLITLAEISDLHVLDELHGFVEVSRVISYHDFAQHWRVCV